jgi:capsular polysaccharide biosynthesis protein
MVAEPVDSPTSEGSEDQEPWLLPSLDAGKDLDSFQEHTATVVTRNAISYRARPELDRYSALWNAKYLIVAVTLVVAAAVYLISNQLTPVYSSSATVSVTAASTPGGSAEDVALASNDLAAQDAQLIDADGVLDQASKALGASSSILAAHVTAGTVDAQNVIQITVQSADSAHAQKWANGVASAFQSFLIKRAEANSSALQNSVSQQAGPLNLQIANLKQEIAAGQSVAPGSAAFTELQSEESQLTELVTTLATLDESTALAIASEKPNVSVLQTAGAPTRISPRPLLYSSIGALLALFIVAQLVIIAARRRSNKTIRR